MAIYSTIAIFEYQTVVFWGSPHRCLPACIFDFQVTSSGFGTQRPSSVFAKVQRCKGVQLSLVVWVHDFFFPKEMLGPSSSSSPGSTALIRFSYTLAPSPEAYLFFFQERWVFPKKGNSFPGSLFLLPQGGLPLFIVVVSFGTDWFHLFPPFTETSRRPGSDLRRRAVLGRRAVLLLLSLALRWSWPMWTNMVHLIVKHHFKNELLRLY